MPKPTLISKEPDYHKNYYAANKDKYNNSESKYCKHKYNISDVDCETYKEDLKDFSKLFILLKKMKGKYENEILETFKSI